uniref:Heparosan-N-sulfate-glucuronate 5-epimerase n=1 Tax=Panagrellus redivivus TaxID=6233 RepID=A0A7E4VKB6_PANRE
MISLSRKYRAPVAVGGVILFFLFIISNISSHEGSHPKCASTLSKQSDVAPSRCIIEGTKRVQCYRDGKDVYLPFDGFLKKQFDLTGRLINKGETDERFEYFTSYAKVRTPERLDYSPTAEFGNFRTYSVEFRDRVRCISAEYGVPMSTQWDTVPYFYPIQIAQYALQHYSRNVTDKAPKIVELEAEFDPSNGQKEVIADADGGLRLKLDPRPDFATISFSWKPADPSAAFSVTVEVLRLNKTITLIYKHVDDRRCVWAEGDVLSDTYGDGEDSPVNVEAKNKQELVFAYALGTSIDPSQFTTVVRDILVDTSKGLALVQLLPLTRKESSLPGGLKIGDVKLLSLSFSGRSTLKRPIRQMTSAHGEIFLRTADWFVTNQDEQGGWPVPVMRSIADNKLVLPAGWHSAMAQGHALSVLTRAYFLTKDIRYVNAAAASLSLFETPALEGGVMNKLFNHPWYEEYPTTPGSFVLNGFMYGLVGLYDFSTVIPHGNASKKLFDDGINSLKTFLPLYDTGFGSVYDLRHLGLKTAPNIARWDYHAVHIYLLKWLNTITNEKFFDEVAERWIGYATGKRAKHN